MFSSRKLIPAARPGASFFHVVGALAEFERQVIVERARTGLAVLLTFSLCPCVKRNETSMLLKAVAQYVGIKLVAACIAHRFWLERLPCFLVAYVRGNPHTICRTTPSASTNTGAQR